VNEGAGTATISATLSNAPTDEPLEIALDNGATLSFGVGETSATSTEFNIQDDDVYLDGETITVNASVTSGGDEFENLNVDDTATVNVSDTTDTATVDLNAPEQVTEGEDITVTATVDNAPETDLTITLNNGEEITIAAGETSSDVTFVSRDDDFVAGADETLTFAVAEMEGGNYEALIASNSVSTVISDNDTTPIAKDDPSQEDYYVELGNVSNSESQYDYDWSNTSGFANWNNEDSTGSEVTITAYNNDGTAGTLSYSDNVVGVSGQEDGSNNNYELGVSGSPRDSSSWPSQQIEYDSETQSSEAISLKFNGLLNEATVGVQHLIPGESGGEVGKWVALYQGTEVASGEFNTSSFDIDTGDKVFDEVRFEALEYTDQGQPTGDSSDYFIDSFQGTGPASANTTYTTAEDETLSIDALAGIIINDTDQENDDLHVFRINGSEVSSGDTVALASGALLTMNSDGSFDYDPNGAFDDLQAGEVDTDTFTYAIQDEHGNWLETAGGEGPNDDADSVATATLTIIGKGETYVPNAPLPQIVDDVSVTAIEDTDYVFTTSDFGLADSDTSVTHIRVDSLPADGQLLFDGQYVFANTEIELGGIEAGQLTFVPDQHESGRDEYNAETSGDQKNDYVSFEYSVGDGASWSVEPSTMTVDVTPVADAPDLSVSGHTSFTQTIDLSNVTDSDSGFSVSAYGLDGRSSGDSSELGHRYGESEKLVIDFDGQVSSVDMSFAWQHSGEAAHYAFYHYAFYLDGQQVGEGSHYGVTDRVDDTQTLQPQDGSSFDRIELTAPGHGDDWLFHEFRFTQTLESDTQLMAQSGKAVDLAISADLVDTDGSETMAELTVSDIPAGVTLTDNNGQSFTATDSDHSVNVLDWNLNSLQVKIPDDYQGQMDLNIKAITEEALASALADQVDPETLRASADTTFSIHVVAAPSAETQVNEAPASTDDVISMDENTAAYTLSVNDLGTYTDPDDDELVSIQIESLPDAEVGDLQLNGTDVSVGDEISATQINDGELTFVPVNDDTDHDTSFAFKVSDGQAWSESTYTTQMNIDAVADAPTVSIDVGASAEAYREISHAGQTITFEEELGEERGDNNIQGSPNYDYSEASTQSFDFGSEFAGQPVTIKMPVHIEGSWNTGSGVFNDRWVVKANGEEHTFDDYGSSANHNLDQEPTETITATLDQDGKVTLEFSAATTQTSETATIQGATATVEPITTNEVIGFEYPVDLEAALADTDGSESLSITVTGAPAEAELSDGSKNDDGSWTITVDGDSYQNDGLTMTVPTDATDFTLTATATATEANPGTDDEGVTTLTASASASVEVTMPEVVNEVPVAQDASQTLEINASDITTNLTFIVDVSSSMSNDDLNLSEEAIESIVQQYSEIGDANVNLIQFWGDNAQQSGWQSPDSLNVQLHDDKSGTDPEQGLRMAVDAYDDSQPQADQDIVFFMGDGDPYNDYEDDYDDYLSTWQNFANHTVDAVKVFGINQNHLDIANEIVSSNETPMYVSNINDFADMVSNMDVEPETYHAEGQLFDNVSGGDGVISIDAIEVGGQSYQASDFVNGNTVSMGGQGELSVDFVTGDYGYTVSSDDVTEDADKSFSVTVSDEDGDTATFDVNIHIDVAEVALDPDQVVQVVNDVTDDSNNEDDYVGHLTNYVGHLTTGTGDDIITIGDDITNGRNVSTGAGNDSVRVGDDVKEGSSLLTGDGNDTIVIGDDVDHSTVDAGSGDDTVTIENKIDSDSVIIGGEGQDTLIMGAYKQEDWEDIQDRISGFETIQFEDGNTLDLTSQDGASDNQTFESSEKETLEGGKTVSYQLGGLTDAVTVEISGYKDTGNGNKDHDGEIQLLKDGNVIKTIDLDEAFSSHNQKQTVFQAGDGKSFDEVVIKNTDDNKSFKVESVAATITADESPLQNGTLVDGIVEGLAYTTSSGITGLTDDTGAFSYRETDTVTFMVGDVIVGTADADDLARGQVFLQDLADVSRSDLNDEYVENMAVFLQSLDEDGNADNGISISASDHAAFEGVSLNLKTASEAEVKAAIEAAAGQNYVNEEEAMAHVQRMLEKHGGQTEFDAHVDDSIVTATLAHDTIEGLRYEASSGLSGEMVDGQFEYDATDTIKLYAGDQLVAEFAADAVGDDGVITFDEAGFTLTLDELDALLNPVEETDEASEDEQAEAVESDEDVAEDMANQSAGAVAESDEVEEESQTRDEALSDTDAGSEDEDADLSALVTEDEAETESDEEPETEEDAEEDTLPASDMDDDSEESIDDESDKDILYEESWSGDEEDQLSEQAGSDIMTDSDDEPEESSETDDDPLDISEVIVDESSEEDLSEYLPEEASDESPAAIEDDSNEQGEKGSNTSASNQVVADDVPDLQISEDNTDYTDQ
jgi:hypothetical protein